MKKFRIVIAASIFSVLVGCNAGMAPEPMNPDQLKSAVDKATPEQQVKWVQSSPMPAAEKAKRIKEIEDKTGYKAPEISAPQTGQ